MAMHASRLTQDQNLNVHFDDQWVCCSKEQRGSWRKESVKRHIEL
ncbi:hypothetical protein HanPSC8_Chr12g0506491 [Helianthus annuus]|nr:hypothetical protein HanPSC8_Chr12g0506491 [Helianthus annuus]